MNTIIILYAIGLVLTFWLTVVCTEDIKAIIAWSIFYPIFVPIVILKLGWTFLVAVLMEDIL
jgi:hypothetical protein